MTDAPWTIGRLLTWTADFLRERGADSPRLDAEVLLAHARGCPRIALYTAFDEPASEELRTQFRELVKQRAAGKPVAYLVGHREFFSLSFDVTPDVLIPRPETEELVVRALDLLKEPRPADSETGDAAQRSPQGAPRVLDVGTGSGAIAVCLAKQHPTAQVTAVDVSPAALAVARRNAEKHDVAQRIEFLESDLLAAVDAGVQFDLIASNPPYVTTAEMAQLDGDVRNYEPHLALGGGEQGTAVIERLIAQAAPRLAPGGWLLIELSPMIAARVEQLLDAAPGLQRRETLKDSNGLARVAQAQLATHITPP
ncbi:MAG: peptide chain release factor N(5)-glutamine methyltransferase [Planctomycetales bacterium]|nr:peptide chain release factor N(5)-glutamine methyltransferase [Planctomycetales bacterium]